MASRLGRRRATQFQSRWVAEDPARAQRLAADDVEELRRLHGERGVDEPRVRGARELVARHAVVEGDGERQLVRARVEDRVDG